MSEVGTKGKGRTSGHGLVVLASVGVLLLLGSAEANAQPRPGELKTVEGKVRNVTTAPRGEVDGAVLEDGTVIHWPPHLEDRFRDLAARGERIRVSGRMETGPEGDTHLEVQALTNLRTKDTQENDAPPPPPRERRDRRVSASDRPFDQEQRIRRLEEEVTQLRREIQRLRKES